MALKTILNKQTDFTGEFPVEYAKSGLWRFNDVSVDEYGYLADSSGLDRKIELVNYLGTTASLLSGQKGRQIRININNPATEKTCLLFGDGRANPCWRLDDTDYLFGGKYLLPHIEYALWSWSAYLLPVALCRQT